MKNINRRNDVCKLIIKDITKTVKEADIDDKEEYLNIKEIKIHVKINKKLN